MAHAKVTPTQKELDLYQKMFNEAAYMGGTPLKYQAVAEKTITGVSSELYEWEDPIDVDGIYEARPKVSLLKRLNWYTEDKDNQPSIVYLPLKQGDKTLMVKRGALIHVVSNMNPADVNIFQVSEVRTDLIPLTFVCNVVPFRETTEAAEEPTVNHVWLNTKD